MRTFIAALLLAAATGCGYVGAPMPPALNIPERVKVLNSAQHADQLVVGFEITGKTTDGLVLHRLQAIDLRAGPPAVSMEKWEQGARPIPVEPPSIDGHEIRVPIKGWENQDIVVAVRAVGPSGRAGAWSEAQRLHIVPLPPVPIVSAATGPDGITLSWPRDGAPQGTKWRISRQKVGEEKAAPVAEATEPSWLDPVTEENAEFTYQVQTLTPAGSSFAESEKSNTVSVTYQDKFPPAIPVGLATIAGVGSIELSWEPNHEPDLQGYRIYRAEASGVLAKLGALTGDVTYSDRAIEHGKRYVYAVSAVDRLGNESKLSAKVEVSFP